MAKKQIKSLGKSQEFAKMLALITVTIKAADISLFMAKI